MSLQLEPAPLLYVDGGEEGATVQISLVTDAVTVAADPDASLAVLTVLDESLDPADPDSRALSSRVESRVTCSAGSVSGSQLAVPPGKHFYSFSLAAPGGSVVAVQSDAEMLFTSPVSVIRQMKQNLHVFSISGQTAEVRRELLCICLVRSSSCSSTLTHPPTTDRWLERGELAQLHVHASHLGEGDTSHCGSNGGAHGGPAHRRSLYWASLRVAHA